MSKAIYLLPLVALAFVVAVVDLWSESVGRSPQTLLAQAQDRLQRTPPDYAGAQRELALALEMALASGDEASAADALSTRADMAMRRRAFGAAREDFERVLDELHPAQPLVYELRLATIERHLGNWSDALARADKVLAEIPNHGGAWTERALTLIGRAEKTLREVDAEADAVLADAPAARAQELVRSIAAREPGEPRRLALLHELAELFPATAAGVAKRVQDRVARAGEDIDVARDALIASFASGPVSDAALAFADLFARAGATNEAVDLALVVRRRDDPARHAGTMQLLAAQLEAQGRTQIAADVLEELLDGDVWITEALVPGFCRTLYGAGDWDRLRTMALRLHARKDDAALWGQRDFYLGVAFHELGQHEDALTYLDRFVALVGMDPPVEDGLGVAHRARAESARALGQPILERLALEAATRVSPDSSGEAWLRLFQILGQNGDWSMEAERALTNALRLLPERHGSLYKKWLDYGELGLVQSGRNLELVRQSAGRRGEYVPDRDVGPYELFKLAELNHKHGDARGVQRLAEALLQQFPDFVPAIDTLILAFLEQGRNNELIDLVLRRLELAGPSFTLPLQLLRNLPPGALEPEQRLRLLRYDPSSAGLLTLARGLRDRGRSREAMTALKKRGAQGLTPEGQLLAAELLHELRIYPAALEMLLAIPQRHPIFPEALATSFEIGISTSDERMLGTLASAAALRPDLGARELLPIVDRLLRTNHPAPARRMLEHLDATKAERDGAVLVRLAVAHMLAGDGAAALPVLDRAEAFDKDGNGPIGRLVVAVEAGEWKRVASRARDVRVALDAPDAFTDAVLSALEDRLVQAAVALDAGHAAAPHDPRWLLARTAVGALAGDALPLAQFEDEPYGQQTASFVRGTQEDPHDPRVALVTLLLVDRPAWLDLVYWRLRDMASDPSVARLWPHYLRAAVLVRMGEYERANELLVALAATFQRLRAAWVLAESLALERLERRDHPALLALREARRRALGEFPPQEAAESALAKALQLAGEGALERALELAREALKGDASLVGARLAIAQILALAGRLDQAIGAYGAYFEHASEPESFEHMGPFLELLERALREEAISEAAYRAELAALAARRPSDPAVVLARARFDLASAEGSSLGADHALERLQRFRSAHRGTALDTLRSGAGLEWARFLTRLDPQRAEELVLDELALVPDLVDVWIQLGEIFEAEGRLRDAYEHYEHVLKMIPDSRVHRRLAQLSALFGEDPAVVAQHLRQARELDGAAGPTTRDRLTLASARANAGGDARAQGVRELAELWSEHERGSDEELRVLVADAYAIAVLTAPELTRDEALAARRALEATRDAQPRATRRDLSSALANLALSVR